MLQWQEYLRIAQKQLMLQPLSYSASLRFLIVRFIQEDRQAKRDHDPLQKLLRSPGGESETLHQLH